MSMTLLIALVAILFAFFEFYQYRRRKTLYRTKCPFALILGGRALERSALDGTDLGTGWSERYIGGSKAKEADFVETGVHDIHVVQQRNKKSAGAKSHQRAFHAKIHLGVTNAEFVVRDDIPEELRVGFLQPGASYQSSVRLSNASGKIQPDTKKDLQGLACKVDTLDGDHDFLATNGSVSHARDAYQFLSFAKAMSGSKLLILPRLVWYVGLFETVRMLATVIKQGSRKKQSLATETYFSRAAYAFGDTACMFRFVPSQSTRMSVPPSDNYLNEDIVARLKEGPVVFDVLVQRFVTEEKTPIEDGGVEWNSALVPVAQLVIPQQVLTTQDAHQMLELVNSMDFNPWNSAEGIRPLGSQNRARKLVYKASVALRKGKVKYFRAPLFVRILDRLLGKEKSDGKAKKSRCPVGRDLAGNDVDGPGVWRPKSSREGIGPVKYVLWNAFYYFLQSINKGLARDPYNKVSWDKWPPVIGLSYLLAKIKFNRSNALTDPYDYAANDTEACTEEPAGDRMAADGSNVSDLENTQMGATNTRFGSNIPPMKVVPDVENMEPSAREVGMLRWRLLDAKGREITQPAGILNNLSGGWIQFQFHGFGGDTKRDPVSQCPFLVKRAPEDEWPEDVARIDRTSKDHTRVTDNGRPTPINERVQAWIQAQIYGTNDEEQRPLRTLEGGQFRLDADGRLPEDPEKPGIDHTGFNKNYNPVLAFLHWLFVVEHNAIADYLASFHPEWDDEELFARAREVNVGQIARIHTIQWTEDLLQHPTLQLGMHADWYGFLGQRLKMWIMRLCHRYPSVERITRPIRRNDIIWGMPGSSWEHHDGPFQVPKQFRLVYRLHEMVLSETTIVDPETGKTLERLKLLDMIHENTRSVLRDWGEEVLGYSFVRESAGHLKLHNCARALTKFQNQQDGEWTDVIERDVLREREDGTGTYNEFRHSVGEPPVTSFMELTGGDAELAREIEITYRGDINAVDAGIGILAEPKPAGFALSYTQFYQFVLNAPRRVKSNRFLTELYTYAHYQEGMNWIEHSGGMFGVMARHLPGLRSHMEGNNRAFAPWKDPEKFPLRQLDQTHVDTEKVFKADVRTLGLGVLAAGVAVWTGASSLWFALILLLGLVAAPAALAIRRMLAMRFMQLIWKKCYTDKRGFMFGTLSRAEFSIERACHWGRMHSLFVVAMSGLLAVLACANGFTFLSILLAVVGFSGISTWKLSNQFSHNAQVLKIALRNRMRVGQPEVHANGLVGGNDLERRCRFDHETEENLRHSSGDINARIYNPDGTVNMEEFELMYRTYAPGRDHLTGYDFSRMHEGEMIRNGGTTSIFAWFAELRKHNGRMRNLLYYYADMVVEEDKKLVPAISKGMLLRYFQGLAQAELKREREEGDTDPSV